MLALLWLTAKVVLLLAGLLLPGTALMRALRVPCTLAACFAGSAVALYATVLGLQFASIRISLGSLTAGLVIIAASFFIVARLVRGGTDENFESRPPLLSRAGLQEIRSHTSGWLLALYALFWFAVLWRAGREPLAGPDIEFRWSFLAEQMLRIGSLEFYPPVSARDFLSYFWAESIPPGASSLHAWAFACAGNANATWTIPAVVLQIVAMHELLWRTGTNVAGARAGICACFAAAACPLLTWSVLLGQETGLTAVSAVGIVFALEAWQRTRAAQWAALAGIFGLLGAMAREYGLVFPALAAAGMLVVKADRRAWFCFIAASALALVWPARTWLLTGNPFYSLALASFPTNPRFIAWIEHDATSLGVPLATAKGWLDIARYSVLFAPAALLGFVVLSAGTIRRNRRALSLLVASLVVLMLWAMSVRYTNGGLFYSLRVTSPALALASLAAGIACASFPRWTVTVAGGLLALTLPATLALPQNPMRTPWREWPAFAVAPDRERAPVDETLALILQTRSPGVVLADSPGFQRRFLPAGVPVIPLWSPQADWLFDRALPPQEAVRRWRESGVRHIIIAKWQSNLDFFNAHSRWAQPPFHVQLIGETALTAVFAITVGE